MYDCTSGDEANLCGVFAFQMNREIIQITVVLKRSS